LDFFSRAFLSVSKLSKTGDYTNYPVTGEVAMFQQLPSTLCRHHRALLAESHFFHLVDPRGHAIDGVLNGGEPSALWRSFLLTTSKTSNRIAAAHGVHDE
jgi:hypothetical protein